MSKGIKSYVLSLKKKEERKSLDNREILCHFRIKSGCLKQFFSFPYLQMGALILVVVVIIIFFIIVIVGDDSSGGGGGIIIVIIIIFLVHTAFAGW